MKITWLCNRQPGYYTMWVIQKIDDDDELYESSFFCTINLTVK